MPQLQQKDQLPYTVQQMYDLVIDIEAYPQFLPWCEKAIIHEEGNEYVIAELFIDYKGFKTSYTSRVDMNPSTSIRMHQIKGPLKYMQSGWEFSSLENGRCDVSFVADFEAKWSLLSPVITPIFHHVAEKIVHQFRQRANDIYGHGT